MPESIKKEHLDRMFPFEFYDELTDNLLNLTVNNPAFINKTLGKKDTVEERRKLYHEHLDEVSELMNEITKMNIVEVEPFGEVLLLNSVSSNDATFNRAMSDTERSQEPLIFLFVQLFDSADLPVFAKDVSDETIENIPEVLHDDPNLLIGVVTLRDDETVAGVLAIPDRIKNKMLEPVDKNVEEDSDNINNDEHNNHSSNTENTTQNIES